MKHTWIVTWPNFFSDELCGIGKLAIPYFGCLGMLLKAEVVKV